MVQQKGFRNEGTKQNIVKKIRDSLSEEEAHRIQEQRRFDDVIPGSHTYNIALHLDSLKTQYRNEQQTISKRIWNVENIQNNINRCKAQLKSGKIYETVPDSKMIMNEYELATYIKHQEWLILGEVRSIVPGLSKIRSVVGHKDYIGKEIMTEIQFNEYVESVIAELLKLGHDLYE